MEKKHINRRKKSEDGDWSNFNQGDWSNLNENVDEKIDPGEILDIQDRAITFNADKIVKTTEEKYKEKSKEFKDGFGNTAQYLKFVNAHIANKKDHIDKILAAKDQFARDIAILNPELLTKEQLDNKNYNKLKSDDVRKVLEHLEEEKDTIKEKIEYFTSKTTLANEELENKNNQVDEVKSQISYIEMIDDSVESKIQKEEDIVEDIQKELKSITSQNESDKIFGAINSLVVLLNSKNQSTLNELGLVKSEFNKMKQEYNRVMKDLEKKKSKK
ncbi:MAG: hypothetical protein QQN43_05735 [Nitrosopumilus sp.]